MLKKTRTKIADLVIKGEGIWKEDYWNSFEKTILGPKNKEIEEKNKAREMEKRKDRQDVLRSIANAARAQNKHERFLMAQVELTREKQQEYDELYAREKEIADKRQEEYDRQYAKQIENSENLKSSTIHEIESMIKTCKDLDGVADKIFDKVQNKDGLISFKINVPDMKATSYSFDKN